MDAETEPEVTFLMTCYNAEKTVTESIDSALRQQGVRIEVVVVDDGSTDGSLELIQRAARSDARVRVVSSPHRGRAHALNLGLAESKASLVAILDADDLARPYRAAVQSEFMGLNPEIMVLGGQVATYGPWGSSHASRLRLPLAPDALDLRLLRGRMPLLNSTTMFRREWAQAAGGYDERLARVEDFDLLLRGWKPGIAANMVQVLTDYRSQTPFPTWAYWRREECHRRLVFRRWAGSRGASTVAKGPVWMADWVGDALRWLAQRSYVALVDRGR
jgi:glycosyltransferase involved in cell wall biosynthesis